MNPKLSRLLGSFAKAYAQLIKALAQPKDEFIRDAAIQRFEFTFEIFWKTLQVYCQEQGLTANSPRASIREAFRLGLMKDDSHYMAMLQSRNLSSHIYEEAIAETIYASLPAFAEAMKVVVDSIYANLPREESGTGV